MSQFPVTLQAIATQRDLVAGQVLFHQGDRATAVFGVQAGRIKLVRYLSNGAEVCLQIATDQESFAEAALFSNTYHCDAIAEIASHVVIYPKAAFLQLLQTDPSLALSFTALLTHQIQALRSQLELHNIHSARERVLRYLTLLAEPGQTTLTFDRPLRHIARDIGLTHEAFYRTLALLEREGAIVRERRTIHLCTLI